MEEKAAKKKRVIRDPYVWGGYEEKSVNKILL